MKPLKIVYRNFGWFKRKHGILLDPLPPMHQKLLLDNKYLRDVADDEQAMQIIFHVHHMEQCLKRSKKIWYKPFSFRLKRDRNRPAGSGKGRGNADRDP